MSIDASLCVSKHCAGNGCMRYHDVWASLIRMLSLQLRLLLFKYRMSEAAGAGQIIVQCEEANSQTQRNWFHSNGSNWTCSVPRRPHCVRGMRGAERGARGFSNSVYSLPSDQLWPSSTRKDLSSLHYLTIFLTTTYLDLDVNLQCVRYGCI